MEKQVKAGRVSQVPKREGFGWPRPRVVSTEVPKGRIGRWLEERLKLSAFNYRIPEHANTIWYALGGAALAALVLLLITGPLMAMFYSPSVSGAHDSINYIMDEAPLGWFVRGVHHWAAYLITALLLLHLGRIIITGSYKKPRELTFYIGLLLLFTMIVMIATGTIVKWDQEGFEALAHFTGVAGMLGGLGAFFSTTLTTSNHILARVFAFHIGVIPMILFGLLAVHLYLVKALKISPLPWRPVSEQRETATFTGHLRLLAKVGLGVTGLVFILALLFRPPFGAPPVGGETGVKPPWMFWWLYALENQLGLKGILLGLGGLFAVLASFPLFDRGEERHPTKRLPAMIVLGLLIAAMIALSILGYVSKPVIHTSM